MKNQLLQSKADDFFANIRRTAIIAMFSDDFLLEKLVLKGGNALRLIHNIGGRTSMDIDLSIDGKDFTDLNDLRHRIFTALKSRFDSEGFVLFDESFTVKPNNVKPAQDSKWGGYLIEFKLIGKDDYAKFNKDLDQIRRNASKIWFEQERIFRIEISRNEYCVPKLSTSLNEFTIYVYTLPMIVIEKLRAICQQLPEYKLRKHSAPRARDFYDLHAVIERAELSPFTGEALNLLDPIFAAKDVPISYLLEIRNSREFHRQDWVSVVDTTSKLEPADFDFYFDYGVSFAEKLYAARVK